MESLNLEQAIQYLSDQQEQDNFCCFHLEKDGTLKAHFD